MLTNNCWFSKCIIPTYIIYPQHNLKLEEIAYAFSLLSKFLHHSWAWDHQKNSISKEYFHIHEWFTQEKSVFATSQGESVQMKTKTLKINFSCSALLFYTLKLNIITLKCWFWENILALKTNAFGGQKRLEIICCSILTSFEKMGQREGCLRKKPNPTNPTHCLCKY